MASSESFDHLVEDLQRAHPTLSRGTVQRILFEEHDLLIGLEPGDIVPAALRTAVGERLARLTAVDADGLIENA